jgi:tetratricopeptide (TPR) repeat protein
MSIKSLGDEAIERGNFQEAVNIFRKDLSQNNSADGYLGLGTAFESLGELLTARWAYNKALELDPNNTDAKHAIASLQETILRQSKDYPVRRKVVFRALMKGIERLDRGQWVPFFIDRKSVV